MDSVSFLTDTHKYIDTLKYLNDPRIGTPKIQSTLQEGKWMKCNFIY